MDEIRARVQDVLLLTKNKMNTMSQKYKATFDLPWDPVQFFKDQEMNMNSKEAWGKIITLTGDADNAQATTTLDYLCQVWPHSGEYVMKLIADVACNVPEHFATTSLPDGTKFQARIDSGRSTVAVVGSSESIAQAGQQLAWLGAALRSSSFAEGVAICIPRLREYRPIQAGLSVASFEPNRGDGIFFRFDFEVKRPHEDNNTSQALFWQNLFQNPVLVSRFPMPSKPEPALGLEISVGILAALLRTRISTGFDGTIFLKGSCTVAIAMNRLHDGILWHIFYNREGEMITYSDIAVEMACDIDLDKVEEYRHFVSGGNEVARRFVTDDSKFS